MGLLQQNEAHMAIAALYASSDMPMVAYGHLQIYYKYWRAWPETSHKLVS
jgi:hypothetical protein